MGTYDTVCAAIKTALDAVYASKTHTHSDKVNTSDVANNLTTTASGKVLDARQGKALSDMIGSAITYIVGSGS